MSENGAAHRHVDLGGPRDARAHHRPCFPFPVDPSGSTTRLRAAALRLRDCIEALAGDTDEWHDGTWTVVHPGRPWTGHGTGSGSPASTVEGMTAAAKKRTGPGGAGTPAEKGRDRVVASNRRARYDYDVLETFECGLVLQGSEVKSLREGRIALQDAFARIDGGEAWLFGVHVPPYAHATGFGAHEPDRRRKLLLHRRQIDELLGRTKQQSLTLIPLSIYFKDGRAKVELALARGRRRYDKRHAIAARDAGRDAAREARAATRGR